MITRIWKTWTTPSNAPAYEELLLTEMFSGIAARNIPGYRSISLGKRDVGDKIEFVTIMWFNSLEAVREFAGENYEVAVVPAKARALLSRFDAVSAHFQTVVKPPSRV